MNRAELIHRLSRQQNNLGYEDVRMVVSNLLEQMSTALALGERIEVRGFGSFSLHIRQPREGRNPKTGAAIALAAKRVPHFKPGKELRKRVN